MAKEEIRLSPLTRLTMTFNDEMSLDKAGVFGRETYEKYLEMQQRSTAKREQMGRALFAIDALLFLLASGQKWLIPGIGIEISAIPAILEVIFFLSALTFFLFCATFTTEQCYNGIVDQFGRRIMQNNGIDPDFFNASRTHFEFLLKIFRPKMNIWGVDFYQHGRIFHAFCWIINAIIMLTLLTLPAAHFLLSWTAATHVFASDLNSYGKFFLLGAVGLINLSGLMMVVGMSTDFTFHMIGPTEEAGSEGAKAVPPSNSSE